jgi:membrane-associated protease RseP (regulator of RpoE activity)
MRGDRIVSVDGYAVKTWADIQENVMTKSGEEIEVVLLRGENERKIDVIPEDLEILVFSINPDLQSELDDSIISEDLRREFEDFHISLSPDATISVEKTGSEWLIIDKDERYSVKKENNRLDIQREGASPLSKPRGSKGRPSPRETQYGEVELAFSINLEVQSDLDNGVISGYLKRKFENRGISLSSDAAVLVEETSSKWLITNPSRRLPSWLRWLIAGKDKKYPVRREEGRLNIYWETEFGMMGVSHGAKPIIRKVEPGSAVFKAGFRPNDVIEAVNHDEILYTVDFFNKLRDASGESATFTVRRDGNTIEMPIALEFDEDGRLISFEGLSFEELVHRDPITAFRMAVPETVRMGGKIFQFLKRMITGDVPMKYIAGPLGIVQITMAVVKTGAAGTLRFAGFLSVNLGIVNLLPLFITDGAVIVFLIVEKLRGKPISRKRQLIIQQAGIAFIALIFLLITYNDILRWITGSF